MARYGPDQGAPAPERVVTVLAISDVREDLDWLAEVFRHSNWKLYTAACCHEAFTVLETRRIPVVVCDCALPDGRWSGLFDGLSRMDDPPLVVVASRHADDRLWAEVLNLGGYDVLSKPFERSEVVRVVSAAWLQWRHRGVAHTLSHEPDSSVCGVSA